MTRGPGSRKGWNGVCAVGRTELGVSGASRLRKYNARRGRAAVTTEGIAQDWLKLPLLYQSLNGVLPGGKEPGSAALPGMVNCSHSGEPRVCTSERISWERRISPLIKSLSPLQHGTGTWSSNTAWWSQANAD